ncbi:hypothetical protein [Pseudarthrobacter albicanus]|nr:hypothetical protein [Pseudarthrobacter albicanus]
MESALTSRNAGGGQIIGLGTNSALRTFTLRRNPLATRRVLKYISDGC